MHKKPPSGNNSTTRGFVYEKMFESKKNIFYSFDMC